MAASEAGFDGLLAVKIREYELSSNSENSVFFYQMIGENSIAHDVLVTNCIEPRLEWAAYNMPRAARNLISSFYVRKPETAIMPC